MREHRGQTARLDAAEAAIHAAIHTRWHRLLGIAALFALVALCTALYTAF
jgi:hypothetical protein